MNRTQLSSEILTKIRRRLQDYSQLVFNRINLRVRFNALIMKAKKTHEQIFQPIRAYLKGILRERPFQITISQDEQEWPGEILATLWNGRKVRIVNDHTVTIHQTIPIFEKIDLNEPSEVDFIGTETINLKQWACLRLMEANMPLLCTVPDDDTCIVTPEFVEGLQREIQEHDPEEILYKNASAKTYTGLWCTPRWTGWTKFMFRFYCLLGHEPNWVKFPGLRQKYVRISIHIGFVKRSLERGSENSCVYY